MCVLTELSVRIVILVPLSHHVTRPGSIFIIGFLGILPPEKSPPVSVPHSTVVGC